MQRGDISYQEKLNELRLDITHPYSKNINYVFVEGKSDIRLFRKLFNLDTCKVETIPGGNPKLEECTSELLSFHTSVLGIRDADFIHLSDDEYAKNGMFLTDCHDIEMSIISNTEVLHSLMFEFTNHTKDKHTEVYNTILSSIKLVGYLKWLNEKESLGLSFSPGFLDLVSFQEETLNIDNYIERVINKSPDAAIRDKVQLNSHLQPLINEYSPDPMQLTNGHDLLATLAKYFNDEAGNKGISEKNIASAIRMAFTIHHFKDTTLYNELSNWEIEKDTTLFVH